MRIHFLNVGNNDEIKKKLISHTYMYYLSHFIEIIFITVICSTLYDMSY